MTQAARRLASVPASDRVARSAQPSSSRLRAPRATPSERGVIAQTRFALRPRGRLGFVVGLLLGSFVPVATYVTTHSEIDLAQALYLQPAVLIALGGLLFSAVTMYRWGIQAFHSKPKALGFVVLLEGVMVTAHTHPLALAALVLLSAINGVSTACNLEKAP
jgi:hypothetical protein